MKLTYLGSGAAECVPARFCRCRVCEKSRKEGGRNIRTRSQALINDDLLIDYPPDSNMHFLLNNLAMSDIHNLLVTHSHPDHLYYEELAYYAAWYTCDEKPELNIYGNDRVISIISNYLKGDYGWIEGKVSERVLFHGLKAFKPVNIGEYIVTALHANHKKDEESFIYIIERDGKRLLYAHDTGYFPDDTWEYIRNKHFDFTSLDCTQGEKSKLGGHMGIVNVRACVKQLREFGCVDDCSQVAVNHFSHNGNYTYDEMVTEMEKDGFIVSYDGAEIDI